MWGGGGTMKTFFSLLIICIQIWSYVITYILYPILFASVVLTRTGFLRMKPGNRVKFHKAKHLGADHENRKRNWGKFIAHQYFLGDGLGIGKTRDETRVKIMTDALKQMLFFLVTHSLRNLPHCQEPTIAVLLAPTLSLCSIHFWPTLVLSLSFCLFITDAQFSLYYYFYFF